MMLRRAFRRRLLLIVTLYVLGVTAHRTLLPAYQGSDEPYHAAYVAVLRDEHRLPDRASYLTNCTRQESGQPPLAYGAAALALEVLQVPTLRCTDLLTYDARYDNEQTDIRDNWAVGAGGRLYAQLARLDVTPLTAAVLATGAVLRLTSLVWGVAAVLAAAGVAVELFGTSRLALVCTGVFAFMPTFIHISAYFNNDVGAVALATAVVWASLRLVRGASFGRVALVGLLIGAGVLVKVSVMLTASAAGVALLIAARERRPHVVRLAAEAALLGLCCVLVAAPWLVYGWTANGDLTGALTHQDARFNHNPPLDLSGLTPHIVPSFVSYIGRFGFVADTLTPAVYVVFLVFALAALLGLLTRWHRLTRLRRRQLICLLVVVLVVGVGYVQWLRTILFVTGRLLYPAHTALVGLGVAGVALAFAPGLRRVALATLLTLTAVGGLVLPHISIPEEFVPDIVPPERLPPLEGAAYSYGGIVRFLGFQRETPRIQDNAHTVRLCWQVLAYPDRPVMYSLKLVRDGVIVADTTAEHGGGDYPSSRWRPGTFFCEQTTLLLDDPVDDADALGRAGVVYDMLLILLDRETLAVGWTPTTPDGTPIPNPFIGQVISPAGQRASSDLPPVDARFGGFAALTGASLDGDVVRLAWRVLAPTPESWTQFVHLYSADGAFVGSLADGIPRAGAYPTWAWAAGETFDDAWAVRLPDDLPPGDYVVRVGFYRADTGSRAALVQDGAAVADGAAAVARFSVS